MQGYQLTDYVKVVAMARVLKMDIFIVTRCQGEGSKYVIVEGAKNFTGQPLLLAHDEGYRFRSLGPYKGMYATLI